jgi:hypothetical protein
VASLVSQKRGDRLGTSQTGQLAVEHIPGLTKLWAATRGAPEIHVAILDAPVDRTNPCLAAARIDQAWLGEQTHCSSHGTEVASVIFGQHDSAVRGIAPGCRGISIPIYECDPVRSPATNQVQLARAIHEALAAGAHVINVSAGQLVPSGIAEPELAAAVRACASAGVLIIAAVGNDGCDCLHVPAALPCVLAVGAMRWDGSPVPGSNWGSIYQTQGILAPGEDISVCALDGQPMSRTGSSYATAIVAGVAALLLSRELKLGRSLRPLLVRKALLSAADRLARASPDERHRFLAGRLDITATTIFLDTWSNTMSDSMNLDLPGEGISDGGAPCDAVPVSIQPSAERNVDPPRLTQPGILPTQPERQERRTNAVEPSACSSCRGERQLVYALGRLNYDFGSEAGLDAFKQRMRHLRLPGCDDPKIFWENANPLDERQLKIFLGAIPEQEADAWISALLWTLEVGGLPLYVIRPEGPQASVAYRSLKDYYFEQFPTHTKHEEAENKGEHQHHQQDQHQQQAPQECAIAEQVGVPGIIAGQATLHNGLRVPAINPDLRALCNWNRHCLVTQVLGDAPDAALKESLEEFLDHLYFELQNAGLTSRDRSLNYAATNLAEPKKIFVKELKNKHSLDSIGAERSKLCRPGSDCWDVTLSFFDPKNPLHTARSVHRYTIDVSEVLPVTVGEIRSWKTR